MLVFGILLRSAVGRLSWSSERGKQFSTENINRLGKACVLHGLGARFHTPLHSCCFFRRKVHRQRYTKKRRRTKSQNRFENVSPANSFCFFFARMFLFDFSLSNGTKTPLSVQKRHFSAIISGTWADFPQRLRQTLPIRGMDPLSTISAMKNGATALRNRKSIFTKKHV